MFTWGNQCGRKKPSILLWKDLHQGIVAQLGMIWCGWRSRGARINRWYDGATESKRKIIFSSAMMKKVKWYQFFKRWLGLKCGNIEPKLDQKIEIRNFEKVTWTTWLPFPRDLSKKNEIWTTKLEKVEKTTEKTSRKKSRNIEKSREKWSTGVRSFSFWDRFWLGGQIWPFQIGPIVRV